MTTITIKFGGTRIGSKTSTYFCRRVPSRFDSLRFGSLFACLQQSCWSPKKRRKKFFINQYSPSQYPPSQEPVQVIPQPTLTNIPDNEPNVITSKLHVVDNRLAQPYSIQVNGWLNNTGGGTAYNLFVHVIAFGSQGLVINDYLSMGGITPHATLGMGFNLIHAGEPIVNCSIIPVYTDALMPSNNCTLP